MKIPDSDYSITSLIDAYHESKLEPPRPHFGCSTLGHPCDRWLWLSFRWAVQPAFPGRILRLFRRGQNEEATIISDLRAIGMDVRASAQQARVSFGSHVSGSIDAIIDQGVPDAPLKPHIAEFKTHSKKSFDALEKEGVEKSKFEHFIQMQVYMLGMKVDRALYLAVCKDDDRIYTERVRLDKKLAQKYVERGQRIALSDRMPEPLSADPSWYQCKFCDGRSMCHDGESTKHANCRTCAHSTAREDSTWHCARWDDAIPLDAQRQGCDSHVIHPDLVPWQMQDGPDEWSVVYLIDGRPLVNGEAGQYRSHEILANPQICLANDSFVNKVREVFGGRVVG